MLSDTLLDTEYKQNIRKVAFISRCFSYLYLDYYLFVSAFSCLYSNSEPANFSDVLIDQHF